MKNYSKLILLVLGVSILSSAATSMATTALEKNRNEISDTYVGNEQNKSGFVRTSVRGSGIETDFTKAAENTVNSVVSIKSFSTPRMAPDARKFLRSVRIFLRSRLRRRTTPATSTATETTTNRSRIRGYSQFGRVYRYQ